MACRAAKCFSILLGLFPHVGYRMLEIRELAPPHHLPNPDLQDVRLYRGTDRQSFRAQSPFWKPSSLACVQRWCDSRCDSLTKMDPAA